MLFKFFNNSRPGTILILLMLLLMVFVSSQVFLFRNNIDINYSIDAFDLYVPRYLSIILSAGAIFTIALVSYLFLKKFGVTRDNSFQLLFFILLLGINQRFVLLSDVLFAYLLIIFAIKNLFDLNNYKNVEVKLFNAGLLISIGSLIYSSVIFYFVLIYVSIVIYGTGGWRRWLIPLLGLAMPFYMVFTFYYWFDDLSFFTNFYNEIINVEYSGNSFFNSKKSTFTWLMILGLTLWGTKDYTVNLRQQKLDTRKAYSLNYLSLLIGAIIAIYGHIKDGSELFLLMVPISAIWAKYIQHKKKSIWREVYFYIVIFIIIASHLLW